MGQNLIKINARIQAYTKGIIPVLPQPTQYDVGKLLGIDDQVEYALLEPALTEEQAEEIIEKLDTIEQGAQVNKIESVSINGAPITINNKNVNIPLATDNSLGVVKSSNEENKISVDDNGKMEINQLNINKLIQHEDQDIILDCLNGGGV